MRDSIELLQAPLGEAPEAFDAIDMGRAAHELISPVIDSQMLRVADINQAVEPRQPSEWIAA
jgi:hypothetical protein